MGSLTLQTAPVSVPALDGKHLQMLECSHSHMLALFAEEPEECANGVGVLYGWGKNRYGQLGLGDRKDADSPQEIPDLGRTMGIRDVLHPGHLRAPPASPLNRTLPRNP